jgi:hypothetical protein
MWWLWWLEGYILSEHQNHPASVLDFTIGPLQPAWKIWSSQGAILAPTAFVTNLSWDTESLQLDSWVVEDRS